MSQITYNGTKYTILDALSNKDLTGQDLSSEKGLNGVVIYNSCLSNETPAAKILPADLSGATFIACNLSNVFIPNGNTVIDCTTITFQVQGDGEDWLVDPNTLKPTEPISKVTYVSLGLSTDPMTVSVGKPTRSVIVTKLEAMGKVNYDKIQAILDGP